MPNKKITYLSILLLLLLRLITNANHEVILPEHVTKGYFLPQAMLTVRVVYTKLLRYSLKALAYTAAKKILTNTFFPLTMADQAVGLW